MTYADQNNLYVMFGKANIDMWADLDNTQNTLFINERITWALELADEYINGRLIYRRYVLPFAIVPRFITYLATLFAGILLHDGRLIKESTGIPVDEVSRVRKEFAKGIRQILNGQLTLLHTTTGEPLEANSPLSPDVAHNVDECELLIVSGVVIGQRSRLCASCWCHTCVCRSIHLPTW